MPEDSKQQKQQPDPSAALATALEGINKTMSGLPGAVAAAVGKEMVKNTPRQPATVAEVKTKKAAPKKPSEDELEGMSRTEFTTHLLEAIKADLIDPLKDELSKTQTGAAEDKVRTLWQQFAKDNPDYKEFEDELQKVLKENPSLAATPEDAFTLAKERNPDKVKELEEKKAAEAKGEEDKSKGEKPAFGGLLPTSGAPGAGGDKEPEKVDLKDASERAWDEAMKDISDSAIGGNA